MSPLSLFALVSIYSVLVLAGGGATASRHINAAGLALVKHWEGFRANFYLDAVGIKTIGYGHACHVNNCSLIHPPLTEPQGSALLSKDLEVYEACVERRVPGLEDYRFSAMVSFTFNLGCHTLEGSTMEAELRAGNFSAAAAKFSRYCHAGGKVLLGLVRRREAERVLFCHAGGCD